MFEKRQLVSWLRACVPHARGTRQLTTAYFVYPLSPEHLDHHLFPTTDAPIIIISSNQCAQNYRFGVNEVKTIQSSHFRD